MARDWTERAGSSRVALAMIGGTLGALTGAAMAGRRESRQPRRPLRDPYYGGAFDADAGTGYVGGRSTSPYGGVGATGFEETEFQPSGEKSRTENIKQRASGMAESVKERATDMAEGVKERSREMKEKLMSQTQGAGGGHGSSREYVEEARRKTYDSFEERPVAFTAGAILLGALVGLLAPVSRKERELIEPVKDKVQEGVRKAADQARETIEHKAGLPEGTLGGSQGGRSHDEIVGATGGERRVDLPETAGTPMATPGGTPIGSSSEGVERSFGEEPERPGPGTVH